MLHLAVFHCIALTGKNKFMHITLRPYDGQEGILSELLRAGLWHNVHSQQHSCEQFLQVQQIGFVTLGPYAMHRGGCLALYYCNMVEWSWWDSSLIWKPNWFPSVLWHCWFDHMMCKNCPNMTYVFGGTLNLAQSIRWPKFAIHRCRPNAFNYTMHLWNWHALGAKEEAYPIPRINIWTAKAVCVAISPAFYSYNCV